MQQTTDPFAGIEKGGKPVIRTVCFAYDGRVTIDTPDGPQRLGDVLLSVAIWLEVEQVDMEAARKVEYVSPNGDTIQRIEFASSEPGAEDWRISLQMPKDGTDPRAIKVRGNWPRGKPSR